VTASGAGADFDNRELLVYLSEVDAELPAPDDGEPVEIAVIGGAAIGFVVPGRVTDDVDVISEGMPERLRAAAASVAARHALRPDWINDAAKVGLPHLDANIEPVYSGERLIVYRADSKYLPATKLHAGRPQDLDDAVPLAVAAGITTSDEMHDLVVEAFPAPLLTPRLQYTIEVVAEKVAEVPASDVEPPGVDV